MFEQKQSKHARNVSESFSIQDRADSAQPQTKCDVGDTAVHDADSQNQKLDAEKSRYESEASNAASQAMENDVVHGERPTGPYDFQREHDLESDNAALGRVFMESGVEPAKNVEGSEGREDIEDIDDFDWMTWKPDEIADPGNDVVDSESSETANVRHDSFEDDGQQRDASAESRQEQCDASEKSAQEQRDISEEFAQDRISHDVMPQAEGIEEAEVIEGVEVAEVTEAIEGVEAVEEAEVIEEAENVQLANEMPEIEDVRTEATRYEVPKEELKQHEESVDEAVRNVPPAKSAQHVASERSVRYNSSDERGRDDTLEEAVEKGDAFAEDPRQLMSNYVSTYKVPEIPGYHIYKRSDDYQASVLFSQPLPARTVRKSTHGARHGSQQGSTKTSFGAVTPAGVTPTAGATKVASMPKERKTGKIAAIVCGIVLGLLLIMYCLGLWYFSGHMFPHTEVGDSDISLMTTAEVESHLETKTANYELRVSGYGYELKLPGDNIKFAFDSASVTRSMHDRQNIFAWPVECFKDHDYTEQVVATYDEATVKKLVNETVEAHNSSATSPTDAHVGYDEASNRIVVIPEEYGTKLDVNATNAAVNTAICSATRKLELTQDQLVQPAVTKDSQKLQKAADGCNSITSMNVTFTVNGQQAFKAGLPCIDKWVDIAEDGSVTLSDEKVSAWISETAADYTTLGNKRTYTRPDGKEVTVEGGDYGWLVDEDAFRAIILDGLATSAKGTEEMPFAETGAAFNGVGKQDWGNRYIDVDMTEQHAYMYDDNGALIWDSDVITGNINIADRATPEGVWSINLMGQNVTLHTIEPGKTEPSDTLVYYWMPFVGNTIGLHDAWWQPGFGGTMYRDGYGSHGCVNLPSEAAASLYSVAHVDDVVVTHW